MSGKVFQSALIQLLMFKIAATNENLTDCEIHSVIRFLWKNNCTAVDIHHERCTAYGKNTMTLNDVRKSVVTGKFVKKVRKTRVSKLWNDQTFSPQVGQTVLTNKLGYHKFCAQWLSYFSMMITNSNATTVTFL